ncbi:hypothetical protein CEQ28_023510 [Hafnia alvei]|nr:hypothetical protein CEQ28_023510 [Hafnia alvei]
MDFESKLRDIELQRAQLQLKMEQAKADRTNEYIDQELKRDQAETDVVKSQADANKIFQRG